MTFISDVAPDASLAVGGFVVVALILGIAGIAVAVLIALKQSLIGSCPVGLAFHPAEPDDFPSLDVNALASYVRELADAEFEWLASYTISAERGTAQPGFATLFWHPGLHVFAEVNQLFPTFLAIPIRVAFFTRFSNGWSATTTDRKADAAVWLLRRPESCWQSLPDAPVSMLVARHRELVHRIQSETGGVPLASQTVENWYDGERRNAETIRTTLERRNIVIVLWEYATYTNRSEWLGALKTARSNARNDYN